MLPGITRLHVRCSVSAECMEISVEAAKENQTAIDSRHRKRTDRNWGCRCTPCRRRPAVRYDRRFESVVLPRQRAGFRIQGVDKMILAAEENTATGNGGY
jgi:hypothetical protein